MVRRGKGGDVVKVGYCMTMVIRRSACGLMIILLWIVEIIKKKRNIKRGGRETRVGKVRGCLFVARKDASMNQSGRLTLSNTKL